MLKIRNMFAYDIAVFFICCFCLPSLSWAAAPIAEVPTLSKPKVLEKTPLFLNGEGVRKVFIFNVYRINLYLPEKSQDTVKVLSPSYRPIQMNMTFLHDSMGGGMLASGWKKGFRRNASTAAMQQALQARLNQFIAMFGSPKKGDVFTFNFLSDGSTHVLLNNHEIGHISGHDFQHALLSVWLGEHPADDDLKQELL